MILQGEEDDGINIVLICGALFIILIAGAIIGTIIFAAYRLYRRFTAGKRPSGMKKQRTKESSKS